MSEMIERVARALALSDGASMVGNSQSKATREFGWDGSNLTANNKYVEAYWPRFKHAAGFALEAMRHPTIDMIEAAHNASENAYGPGCAIEVVHYRAMIDDALK